MLARAKPAGDLLDDSRSRMMNRFVGDSRWFSVLQLCSRIYSMVNYADSRRASAVLGYRPRELSRVSICHLSRFARFDRSGGGPRARRGDRPDLREGHRAREAT